MAYTGSILTPFRGRNPLASCYSDPAFPSRLPAIPYRALFTHTFRGGTASCAHVSLRYWCFVCRLQWPLPPRWPSTARARSRIGPRARPTTSKAVSTCGTRRRISSSPANPSASPAPDIDFVADLGIEKQLVHQFKVVLRPATKHKFRFEYTPIKYDAQGVLRGDIIFNGIRFPLAIPVETDLTWRAYRFGYEWDFVYRDRGFVGLLLEAKYTDVEATLSNGRDSEFVRARAPIPAIGVIGRGYVLPNISITGEFSFFKLPESIDEDYQGKYFDFDLYGTVNFTDNFGAQAGYRSFDVFYKIEDDEGELNLKGLYFGGVVRF